MSATKEGPAETKGRQHFNSFWALDYTFTTAHTKLLHASGINRVIERQTGVGLVCNLTTKFLTYLHYLQFTPIYIRRDVVSCMFDQPIGVH